MEYPFKSVEVVVFVYLKLWGHVHSWAIRLYMLPRNVGGVDISKGKCTYVNSD